MWLQGPTAKESDSSKDSSRRERLTVIAKRAVQAAAHAAVMQHKKPTSSVEADITGGSTLNSQAVMRQEVSTATSKSYTFKTGMIIYALYFSFVFVPHSVLLNSISVIIR